MMSRMSKVNRIPQEARRLLARGATVTQARLAVERSSLSSRSRVLREANRRGKWFGVLSRTDSLLLGRAAARRLAADSAAGRDPYLHCAVPDRWCELFIRVFVKSAVYAAHANRSVSVSSKYGVP
jgi:hypothetical protein